MGEQVNPRTHLRCWYCQEVVPHSHARMDAAGRGCCLNCGITVVGNEPPPLDVEIAELLDRGAYWWEAPDGD